MEKPRKICGALSGRQDLNLRPPGPKPGALPPAPLPDSDFDEFYFIVEAAKILQ